MTDIADLTALTTPASGDLLHVIDVSETAARQDKSLLLSTLFANISGTFTYPSTYPAVITGSGANETGPAVQLLVRNTSDYTPVTQDYRNEAHIRLQAGTTSDHVKYINFADYSGTDKWVMGSNSSHTFILYNSDTVHRLWFQNDGVTYINSAGTNGVLINYHGSDSVGTGGLTVHRGGLASGNQHLFRVTLTTAGDMDSQTNVMINSGATTTQNAILYFQDQGTNKYLLAKTTGNNFYLYDYANSMYALYWNTTDKRMGINTSGPATPLHVKLSSTGTNTVGNVIAIEHDTSGTVAAGFGAGLSFYSESASVATRNMGRLYYSWETATDASRNAQGFLTAYYTTTERTAMQWIAGASAISVGFFGATPVTKPSITGSRDGNAALASLLTELANLGLITDGTTAS